LIFLLIIGLLDENSLWSRYERRVEIKNLKREIAKYQEQYETEKQQLQLLENSCEMVEKLAREKYRMKRPNEDVFVFVNPGEGYEEAVTPPKPEPVAVAPVPTTVANDSAVAKTDSAQAVAPTDSTSPAKKSSNP